MSIGLGNAVRGAGSGQLALQQAQAPTIKYFDVTAAGQVFYVNMAGRTGVRVQLGSGDGKAVTLTTVSITAALSLAPVQVGKGSTLGQQNPPAIASADWVAAAGSLAALGAFYDVAGPANLLRLTVAALTGLSTANLQLWIL